MSCTIVQCNWSRDDECNAAFSSVVNERDRERGRQKEIERERSTHVLTIGRLCSTNRHRHRTVTYLSIRSQRRIYSPPAPIKS